MGQSGPDTHWMSGCGSGVGDECGWTRCGVGIWVVGTRGWGLGQWPGVDWGSRGLGKVQGGGEECNPRRLQRQQLEDPTYLPTYHTKTDNIMEHIIGSYSRTRYKPTTDAVASYLFRFSESHKALSFLFLSDLQSRVSLPSDPCRRV